jgi:hypothetical protein
VCISDDAAKLCHLFVRELEELVQEAEFVHHVQRRGVNRVTSEVPEEIAVLFQHRDRDSCASQEKAEHHPGWSAAHDAALHADLLRSARRRWRMFLMQSGHDAILVQSGQLEP